MKMRSAWLICLLTLFAPGAARAQDRAQWVPLDGVSKPGTPIQAVVTKVSQEGTTFQLSVPGMWMESVSHGGRPFTRLVLPAVQLAGTGFPAKAGEAGWYDFPTETGLPPGSPDRFVNALSVGVPKPLFPEKLLGQKPRTGAEMERLGIDPAGARPGVPALRGLLAVSRGNRGDDLAMELQSERTMELKLPSPLAPAGFDGLDITAPPEDGYLPPELIDEAFYGEFRGKYRGVEAPLSEVSGAGAGFATVEARIPLVEVTTPELVQAITRVTVFVKHLKGTEDFTCPIAWDAWTSVFPFINGAALRESFTAKGIRIEASRSARYLIVTPKRYRDELNEFALWKQAKGLNVDFAYLGSAAGDDVAADREAIDAYLESYFKANYCHGVYVLLVGDVDVLPGGRSNRVTSSPDNGNADSDHVYEVLGGDRFPSLYVGRLSVNSEAELLVQLKKTLDYERDPAAGDWPTKATLAANSENDDGTRGVSASFPSKYAAAVNAIASHGGYMSPPVFQKLHAGAASAAATRAVNSDVTGAIGEGRGQVLYRGHGNSSSWAAGWDGSSANGSAFTAALVTQLENKIHPIVYSIACQNARLLNSDCIAELWMNQDGGAVAHFGASVNSMTTENHERSKGIFRALYESGFTRLGPALAEAERISHNATGGGASWDNNTFCYNLLGDPELTVRKKPVLRVFLAGNLAAASGNLVVRVVAGEKGAAAAGSFVKATLVDGRAFNGFANENGEWTIPGVTPDQIAYLDLQADGYSAVRQPNTRRERQWIAFDPEAKPGTPVSVSIVELSQTGTVLNLKIPGAWVRTEQFGGREVSVLEFPGLDKLAGPGIPREPGQRGWYDFPEETGIPPLPPARFEHPFEQGIYQPVFPEKALGQTPKTEREMIALGIDPAGARPGIPVLRGFLAVSRQTRGEDLAIDLSESTRQEILLPAPLRPAGFTGSDQTAPRLGYAPGELFDEDFYAAFEGAYRGPEAPIEFGGSAGAFGVAEVKIPLAEMTRPTVARVFTSLRIFVKHLKGTEDFDCPFGWDSWVFNLPFINGAALRESMTAKGIRIEGSRSAHYLIVTPREYRDELDEFARWKQAKGLNVDFAYLGSGTGGDVAADRAAIDAYLEAYFKANYCHGVYVLLVGDVGVLPSGRSARVDSSPDFGDADSDHVYEVLGSDRFPSLYVGRLSVNSADELKIQLAKILSYERYPAAGDWPTRATLAANSENDNGTRGVSAAFPSKYAAAVNATAAYGGYDAPPTFQVLHAGASSAAADRALNQDVTDAIEAGRGMILYRGHGNGESWVGGWDGSSTDGISWSAGAHVSTLGNQAYPIVFSIACQNARLRNDDSIAETWLSREGGGAVAHFGASVNSYTAENHERTKGLFRAFYESGFTRLGPGLAEGERISFVTSGGGGGWDNNTFCYNLLGDPELTVRKRSIPLRLKLTPTLAVLKNTTVLTLRDSGNALVSGALVNIVLKDGKPTNLFTSVSGTLVLPEIKPEEIRSLQIHADGYAYTESVPGGPGAIILTALGFGRQGEFRIGLESTGDFWIIEVSPDLVKWTPIGTAPAGSQTFSDPDAGQFGHRYYRAVSGN